ncbi:MAG: hypothetical protein AUJ98_03950 [Bacteroidetes bacterium CG2_30_33_31]|nr:MAG: hypothetical protein AUJ98_03950 [Bacteroidetes bacterium CG2_30_33_31]
MANKNTLNLSSSPYLLEHANNPVHWHEWGEAALELAKNENKPIIISIGYAACHWCHVMADESFMDSAVAEIMNTHFVCIKVDREERPDLDQIYMNAAQLINGNGGWPLNAFALPDGRPFYAGTYFNKMQWIQLLSQIWHLYKDDFNKVLKQAELITNGIKSQEIISVPSSKNVLFEKNDYIRSINQWQKIVDLKYGGSKNAPKFPLPIGWEYLLQYYYFTGDIKALDFVNLTLINMAKGGIYDQIGGGFARYSTDERWFAPHFEKMLYDNAQLVSLYSNAYKVSANPDYKRIVEHTLAFVLRELTEKEGGFFSSLNADSEKKEGKYYVWTKAEIDKLFDKKTALIVCDYFNIQKNGNWENGQNILFLYKSYEDLAAKYSVEVDAVNELINQANMKIFDERSKRIRPSTDDKVLSSWNALMLKAFVDAFQALGNKEYLEIAKRNADFYIQKMIDKEGKIFRNYKNKHASIDGFLDDYAMMADAMISLYQTTFDIKYLNISEKLTNYAVEHFRDDRSGMFFYTSNLSKTIVARKMEISDNVIPSSNSVMANVLYKLSIITEKGNFKSMSEIMLNQVYEQVEAGGPYYASWAQLLGLMTNTQIEVAILGKNYSFIAKEMQKNYLPNSVFVGGIHENLPLLKDRLKQGKTLIYICKNKVCILPTEDAKDATKEIKKERSFQ